jgi:probable rRNA maturation factor
MTHRQSDREKLPDSFALSLANQQCGHAVNEQQLIDAARLVLQHSGLTSATISLAVVDDPTIHDLNRRYLNHDWPTDVLSFALDERDGHLEGEVILSADTAAAEAAEIGWPAAAEQLLYVIHGTLHLVGYRDKTTEEARAMRAAEERYLRDFGIDQPQRAQSTDGAEGLNSGVDKEEGQVGS